MEAVFATYFLLILRLVYLCKVDALCLGIGCYQILAVLYILLLELASEPLVDLVLGLCALYDLEQSRLGPLEFCEVITSIWSPFLMT